jgi:hypothetical protein
VLGKMRRPTDKGMSDALAFGELLMAPRLQGAAVRTFSSDARHKPFQIKGPESVQCGSPDSL